MEPAANAPSQELTETILYEYLLAEIAAQRGEVGLAAQAFVDLAKRTRDPRIARRAAEMAIFARMANAAIEAARIWNESEPDSTRARQTLIGLLLAGNQFNEAEPLLKKMLAMPGANVDESFGQIGRALAGASNKAGALQTMRALAAEYTGNASAQFSLAQVAYGAGNEQAALEAIRRARTLRPEWEQAVLFEAQIHQRRSNTEALQTLREYLKSYAGAREVRIAYARLLAAEKRLPEARAEFQSMLASFPDNTDVIYAVALLSLQLNDYPLAETNLKRLLELDYPNKDLVRLYLGQAAEEQKRMDEARDWYARIESGEQYVVARIRYAQVLAKQKKLDEARGWLQASDVTDGQQRVQLLLAEAQLLRDAEQIQAAFDLVAQELERRPNSPELLYDQAMLAERLDRLDVMEQHLRKLIAMRPDHAHAHNALGYTFADRNIRLNEARELIERALKLAPNDSAIMDSMGWVLFRLGQIAEAVVHLERAFASRPDAEIGAHLGEALWVSGRRDEAERIFKETLEKYPSDKMLLDTIKRILPR